MKIYKFGEEIKKEICLCLGNFDSVHVGHREIFGMAKALEGELSVFTFSGEISTNSKSAGLVYTFSERLEIFENLGVKNVIVADFQEIKDLSSNDFIQILKEKYQIKNIVCGFDYKFGKMASGDTKTLKNHFEKKLKVCEKVVFEEHKASASTAKTLIENGEIEK